MVGGALTKPGPLLSQLLGLYRFPGAHGDAGNSDSWGPCMPRTGLWSPNPQVPNAGRGGKGLPMNNSMVVIIAAGHGAESSASDRPIGFACPISPGGIQQPASWMRKLRLIKTE